MVIMLSTTLSFFLFFFNDTATTEIYTLSLHDALPIYVRSVLRGVSAGLDLNLLHRFHHGPRRSLGDQVVHDADARSEEHTSELQSHLNLVCRLLLEKKKTITNIGKR